MVDLSSLRGLGHIVWKFVEAVAHGKYWFVQTETETLGQGGILIAFRFGRRLHLLRRVDKGSTIELVD